MDSFLKLLSQCSERQLGLIRKEENEKANIKHNATV